MPRKPTVEEELKGSKPKLTQAKGQSHQPAKHIEETARLAGSVETAKDPEGPTRQSDRLNLAQGGRVSIAALASSDERMG
jgi:hypothetical protein